MATIEQLTQQLVNVNENQNDTAKETKKEISDLSKSVKDLLKFQKEQARKSGQDLEAEREASRRTSSAVATSGGSGASGGDAGGSMGGIGSMLGGVAAWAGGFLLKFTKIFGMLKRMFMFGARATGIGAVIYLIYQTFKDIGENKNFQEAIEKIKESWNSIKTSFTSIKNKIVGFFVDENGEKTDLTKTIEDTINSITEFLVKPLNRIKCTIQDFVSVTLSTVVKSIETIFNGIDLILSGEFGAGLNELFKAALGWDFEAGKMTTESMGLLWLLKNSYDAVLSLMPDMEVVIPSISKSFDDMWNSLSCHIEDGLAYITEKWEVLSGFFTETIPGWIETTKDKFVTAWDISKDLLKTKWDEVVKFFTVDVPKYFTDWLTTAVDNVAAPIAATWARVVDWFLRVNTKITTKYEEIKAFGSDIISKIKDTWCNVVEFFTVDIPAKMKAVWETIKALGSNLLGTAETGLKMYWDFLVDFYTVKIPAAMKAVWEIIKAGGTGILDNISAKWESLKCFFTDTIPEKISNFLSPLENFDVMEFITEKFEAVKCFFTDTIPNKIAEFNPLGEFNLMEEIGKKVADMLAMIFDLIPSIEDIKNTIIRSVNKLGSAGKAVMDFFGLGSGTEGPGPLTSKQEVAAATAERTEQGLKPFAGILGVQAFNPKTGDMQDHNYLQMKTFLANEHSAMNKHLINKKADDERLERLAQSDKLGLIADKLEALITEQAMRPQNEGLKSMVNNQTYNYVTAPATSTDDEYGGLLNRLRRW
jgi:phage-related protein